MTAMNNSQFAEFVLNQRRSAPAFQPTTTFDPDGDCVEFIAKPGPFYAKRIDDLLTVYYDQESDEIIGSLIKGIAGICRRLSEKMPAFKIEVEDGPVKLEHLLFLTKLLASPDDSGPEMAQVSTLTYRKQVYKKLIEAAGQSNAEAELTCI